MTMQRPSETAVLPAVESVLRFMYGDIQSVLRTMKLENRAALLQGCLPLLLHEIPADTLRQWLGEQRYGALRAYQRAMSVLNLWNMIELEQLLTVLAVEQIPIMLMKGVDLATSIYPQSDLRYFDDIDVMVHPKDVARVVAVLEQQGYAYHQEYRFEAISTQRVGFVYAKPVAAGHIVFEIHTAPHVNEFGITFDVASLWQHARPLSINGLPALGMGLEDLLLYLCWHYRSHTFERLIWLYDIAVLLRIAGKTLDWDLLMQRATHLKLRATLSYVLRWCEQLFQVAVPAAASCMQETSPLLVRACIARWLGTDTTQVLRRKASRERKLLQYLLVDDLWMLGLVMWHAVFPTPTHLGRRYMEHSPLPLRLFWVYYFVHPFFALWEAVTTFRQRNVVTR